MFYFETWNHSILFALICFHLLYHSLSFPDTHCHLLPLIITRFITRCHSLSFVVTRCTTHCYSLYNSLSFIVPLVATQCTTRRYFYKRLQWKQMYFYWSIVLSSYLETFKNREIAFVISKFGNLSKLELTDFNENSLELPIGILVGVDYHHQFLTHKIIKNEWGWTSNILKYLRIGFEWSISMYKMKLFLFKSWDLFNALFYKTETQLKWLATKRT